MTSQPVLRKQRTCEDMNSIHIPVTGICNVCVVFGEKGSMLIPHLTAADPCSSTTKNTKNLETFFTCVYIPHYWEILQKRTAWDSWDSSSLRITHETQVKYSDQKSWVWSYFATRDKWQFSRATALPDNFTTPSIDKAWFDTNPWVKSNSQYYFVYVSIAWNISSYSTTPLSSE